MRDTYTLQPPRIKATFLWQGWNFSIVEALFYYKINELRYKHNWKTTRIMGIVYDTATYRAG